MRGNDLTGFKVTYHRKFFPRVIDMININPNFDMNHEKREQIYSINPYTYFMVTMVTIKQYLH